MEYTKEELDKLKETMDSIGAALPTNLTTYIWNNYKQISGNSKEPKPCSCPSAGRLWAKAIDTIRGYLNNLDNS